MSMMKKTYTQPTIRVAVNDTDDAMDNLLAASSVPEAGPDPDGKEAEANENTNSKGIWIYLED